MEIMIFGQTRKGMTACANNISERMKFYGGICMAKKQKIGDILMIGNGEAWDVYLGNGDGFEVDRDSEPQAIAEILSRIVKIEKMLKKRNR